MIKIECGKCKSQYNINDDQIGKKAKCNCGEIIEIKVIGNNNKFFKNRKLFISIGIVVIILILAGIFYNKREFIEYKGYYYSLNGKKSSIPNLNVYDINKKLLYKNVNIFDVNGNNGNYIICNNEKHFNGGKEIPKDSNELSYDIKSDCNVYDSKHKILGSDKIEANNINFVKIYYEILKKY